MLAADPRQLGSHCEYFSMYEWDINRRIRDSYLQKYGEGFDLSNGFHVTRDITEIWYVHLAQEYRTSLILAIRQTGRQSRMTQNAMPYFAHHTSAYMSAIQGN